MSMSGMFRMCNTEINQITVIVNRSCRTIIQAETLRDLLYQQPTEKRPIEFGISFITNDPNPKDIFFSRPYYERNLVAKTLLIDVTKEIDGSKKRTKLPTIFKIKIPDGCTLTIQPPK